MVVSTRSALAASGSAVFATKADAVEAAYEESVRRLPRHEACAPACSYWAGGEESCYKASRGCYKATGMIDAWLGEGYCCSMAVCIVPRIISCIIQTSIIIIMTALANDDAIDDLSSPSSGSRRDSP